jgi:peroxiredoxin
MKSLKFILLIFAFVIINTAFAPQKQLVNDFSLMNIDGNKVSLANYKDAKGFIIVFTCNHCPFAKLYPPRLNELNNRFKPLGVPLIAISSTDTMMYEEDTYPNMVTKAKEEQFNFPYLFDEMQTVAKNFKAQKTPHAFVIWKEKNSWVVKYNGAIDDNGMEPKQVSQQYVADAVNALLNGKPILTKETKSIGCQIAFRKK